MNYGSKHKIFNTLVWICGAYVLINCILNFCENWLW